MKFTNETLFDHYLEDLKLPDIHHGRTTPKVKYLDIWRKIKPRFATTPRIIDPLGPTKIFVWSDLHFGHKNIIKYANRPFPDVPLMNSCLIGNYLNTVTHNDIVIFGGDIGFLSENNINSILTSLPGYKIQIIGNHDIHRDGTLYNLAFDESWPCMVLDVNDADYQSQLLFTHYPLDNIPIGCINIHGHIHQNPAPTIKHVNISVEYTNYTPIPLSNVLQIARAASLAGI